ncbi:MAG: type II secretion system F family protein [Burkholderiales bacterium]
MPYFAFEGRNNRGELVKGVLEGGSSGAIADQLFNTGITPISIAQTGEGSATEFGWLASLRERKISITDLMLFCRQLYTQLKAGVPIIRSLAGLRESAANPALARVVQDLRENLESGRDLNNSMMRHPRVFSPFMVSLTRVGELTGQLEEVFFRLYTFLAFEKYMREKIKAAVRYPLIVLFAMAVGLVIVNVFVIPVFAKFFAQFNAPLPLMTRMLIGFSQFMIDYWALLLAAAAGAVIAFQLYTGTPDGRYRWDRLKLRLPVAGPIIHKATLARFARSMALAGKSGVPIVQALSVVSQVVDNAFMQERLEQMRDGIERGESILRTASAAGIFNPVVLQMVAVGEETGELDALMEEVADLYEREVEYEVEGLAAKIEPILIVVIGIGVLILALGIFLPMWSLASAARGGR